MYRALTEATHARGVHHQRRRHARGRDARGSRRRASSSTPGPTPHSDECANQPPHFGALTHDERVKALGEAVLKSGALIFTKCHSGKYTAVNDDFLAAFGLESSDEVIGLNDEELIDKVLSSGESGKMFHHSYRGESIADLPKIWQAHDDEVLSSQRTMWYKERAIVKGGDDMKLHEYIVLKSPHKSSIGDEVLGVAVLDGI
jgi:PAS domain-containing protein